ncbi:energy transducer TonB [Rheinheimera sp. F8]|uniref:energy transducer TonB n=1 Tax=Rheinheimera sp. F8 TaxID=1763998 RepID=UPI000A4EEE23|nr:energy transducer TonB [Rheinheimera sp. F8]
MTTISMRDNPQVSAVLLDQQHDSQPLTPLPALGRGLTMTLTAALISFALFQLMAQLVQSTAPITAKVDTVFDVTPLVPREESAAKKIIREIPPPPVPQLIPKLTVPTSAEPGDLLDVPISAQQPVMSLQGPTLETPAGHDKAATPLVRIEPKYPPAAARDGVNGWVRLRFNIAADGRVTDVKVLAAEPRRVFDQEAMRALKNWKYQPKLENGRAVAQSDLEVQLDFRLDQQG